MKTEKLNEERKIFEVYVYFCVSTFLCKIQTVDKITFPDCMQRPPKIRMNDS